MHKQTASIYNVLLIADCWLLNLFLRHPKMHCIQT